jgi:hypothetical protein
MLSHLDYFAVQYDIRFASQNMLWRQALQKRAVVYWMSLASLRFAANPLERIIGLSPPQSVEPVVFDRIEQLSRE